MEHWEERLSRIEALLEASALAREEERKAREKSRKEAEERGKRLDERLDRLNEIVNGVTNTNGMVAEESFFNSLQQSKIFGGIHFDRVDRDWHTSRKLSDKTTVEGQYDIVMINDVAICIVEVKQKVRPGDIEKLATVQVDVFKKLFSSYAEYNFYLGIAGLCFDEKTDKRIQVEAQKYGVGILKVVNDTIVINDRNLKVY
jgi:hypothetical protein